MFKYEIHNPSFGTLTKEGKFSKIWKGSLILPCFIKPFEVLVRGTADGPLPRQVAAMQHIVTEADDIKRLATLPMRALYEQSDLLSPSFGDDSNRIWDFLDPAFIEVSNESYYEEEYEDGRIAVAIAFQSIHEPNFIPAIETADGWFIGVLSGT